MADDRPMRMEGQTTVAIGVGHLSIRHTVVVVDCSDEGILGADMLTCGSAPIDLATKTVSLEGWMVALKSVDEETCRRVSLAEGVVVHARHQNLVRGRISDRTGEGTWLVEPLPGVLGGKDLLVARTLTCNG